jgi:chromosome segregation ATPase
VNENNHTVSFDRMRNMLTRAAEIRESEQQQIFDALDEIHARLSPLESIGAVRKRLSEMPDRSETAVLADRLDAALRKLEAQDTAIAALARAVDNIVDKLATPFAQLDGRLDGVTGRFEGVAGRMDGLEDKLSNIHRRIDELDHHLDKQDTKIDNVPSSTSGPVRERIEIMETALRGRLDEVDEGVHEHLDGTKDALARQIGESSESVATRATSAADSVAAAVTSAETRLTDTVSRTTDAVTTVEARVAKTNDSLHAKLDTASTALTETREALAASLGETGTSVHGKLDEATSALREALRETQETVDASDRLETLAERLERVTTRLDEMTTRLDAVEDGFTGKIGELSGAIKSEFSKVDATLGKQPDSTSVESLVRKSNEESVRRIGGHLDEAMATFAELMLGGSQPTPQPPTTLPRQNPRRRTNGTKPGKALEKREEDNEENDVAAGA